MRNKNLKTVRSFSWSEVTLNEQISHSDGESWGVEPTPRKFCELEPPQSLYIAFLVLEKDQFQMLWLWKLAVTATANYDWGCANNNIFCKTRMFYSSSFFDKSFRLYFIWSHMRVSGSAVWPQWGVLGKERFLEGVRGDYFPFRSYMFSRQVHYTAINISCNISSNISWKTKKVN